MVTFRGDVVHEVSSVEAGAPVLAETRISLVIEQYRVAEALRSQVPRFELHTAEGAVA